MLLWSPYAISAFSRSFTAAELPENFHLWASVIAKTTLIWTPLFFIVTDGYFKNYMKARRTSYIASRASKSQITQIQCNTDKESKIETKNSILKKLESYESKHAFIVKFQKSRDQSQKSDENETEL